MDVLDVLASEFPSQNLTETTTAHPLLHSRITELLVFTLLKIDFNEHEIWTKGEIRSKLQSVAKHLNARSVSIYPNRLSEGWPHIPFIFKPKSRTEEEEC